MKFLIDAQLPPALKFVFSSRGYEACHTLDLPLKNDTPDQEIVALAEREGYISNYIKTKISTIRLF